MKPLANIEPAESALREKFLMQQLVPISTGKQQQCLYTGQGEESLGSAPAESWPPQASMDGLHRFLQQRQPRTFFLTDISLSVWDIPSQHHRKEGIKCNSIKASAPASHAFATT